MFFKTLIFCMLLSTGVFAKNKISRVKLVRKEPRPNGLLYPSESESREVRLLDGLWDFVKSDIRDPMQGLREEWYRKDLKKVAPAIPMPVPASYNDITIDKSLRDHVGTVWYQRQFFVPHSWAVMDQRIWLRFGSVHYAAIVWVNDDEVVSHSIGHLPFEAEITAFVKFGSRNRVTVLCDNTLLNTTIPQGEVLQEQSDNGAVIVQDYTFDFFNYAGIHRSVHLYTTPTVYIQDVKVTTNLSTPDLGEGLVNYYITVGGLSSNIIFDPPIDPLFVHVQLRDREGDIVASKTTKNNLKDILMVSDVKPWWPYLMHPEPGYMYTLEIYLHAVDDTLLDIYRLKIGIRTLNWDSSTFLLNNKPLYLRGFGKHEDSDIRGKGLDYALLTRDFNLIKWIGANAYRTSHYPYSEESMQFADEQGIMIIDECPSVNTRSFSNELFYQHQSSLRQLIHRDYNHPSVIMWSIANEPRSEKGENYFRDMKDFTSSLDKTRPVTAAINVEIDKDVAAKSLDIISFNRYNSWYHNSGQLNMITQNVIKEATAWHERYNKPVIMMEYGADSLEGLHFLPSAIWSEDYQAILLSKHFEAFDKLRAQKWFIGEFVWNFADFKTAQSYTRVGGNKKGLFTRNRQPKTAAYLLRQRYFGLCYELDHCGIPGDLFNYVIDWKNNAFMMHGDEL